MRHSLHHEDHLLDKLSPCLPCYSELVAWPLCCVKGRIPGRAQPPALTPVVSAGVWATALGKAVPAFPKGLRALLQPRWFQFEASTQRWNWIEFLPWNQQDLLQHFAWIKIFVPFFTGQKEDSWSLRRKEIITGPYRSRSCATAAHSLRGRNIGPQTRSTTLSKCLWAAQEKHPSEAYLITSICNRLNVRSGVLGVCTYLHQGRRDAETENSNI